MQQQQQQQQLPQSPSPPTELHQQQQQQQPQSEEKLFGWIPWSIPTKSDLNKVTNRVEVLEMKMQRLEVERDRDRDRDRDLNNNSSLTPSMNEVSSSNSASPIHNNAMDSFFLQTDDLEFREALYDDGVLAAAGTTPFAIYTTPAYNSSMMATTTTTTATTTTTTSLVSLTNEPVPLPTPPQVTINYICIHSISSYSSNPLQQLELELLPIEEDTEIRLVQLVTHDNRVITCKCPPVPFHRTFSNHAFGLPSHCSSYTKGVCVAIAERVEQQTNLAKEDGSRDGDPR